MMRKTVFKTRWGWVGMAATETGVADIVLSLGSRRAVEAALSRSPDQRPLGDSTAQAALLRQAKSQVLDYLKGKRTEFTVPVDLAAGTPFQRRVWRTILRIPYGRVRSYQWVALRVGGKQFARAVGMALGANPVPIIVPCHRIVAHDGTLGGFSCGLPVKKRLLQLEGTLKQLQT